MKLSDRQKKLSDPQKMALALRRLRRAFAVAIYPPLDQHTLNELDAEFQKGFEIAHDIHQLMLVQKKEEGIRIGLMVNCPNCNYVGTVRTCPDCKDKESMR